MHHPAAGACDIFKFFRYHNRCVWKCCYCSIGCYYMRYTATWFFFYIQEVAVRFWMVVKSNERFSSRNNQGLPSTTYLVQTIYYTSLRIYYDPQNGISLVLLYESVKCFFVATSGACVFLFFFFYKSDLRREKITVRS